MSLHGVTQGIVFFGKESSLGKLATFFSCYLTARPDKFIQVGLPIKPLTTMSGQYQYIDLLAANMEITLMPGQYLGFASTSTAAVAFKYLSFIFNVF